MTTRAQRSRNPVRTLPRPGAHGPRPGRRDRLLLRALGYLLLMIVLGLGGTGMASAMGGAADVMILEPGSETVISPADTECFGSTRISPDANPPNLLCPLRGRSACEESYGEAAVSLISCVTLRKVEGDAHTHYQRWFRVEPIDKSGVGEQPSFVPIHIFAPGVTWDFVLDNNTVKKNAGYVSASVVLRLRKDPIGDLSDRGRTVTETPVILATHGGINGCLSVPLGASATGLAVSVASVALKCALEQPQAHRGRASPSLFAIVEVGTTYTLELAMDVHLEKRVTAQPTGLEVSARNLGNTAGPIDRGNTMRWSEFVITVGSLPDR